MIATVVALAIIGGYALYFALNTASPAAKPTPRSPAVSTPSVVSPSPTGPPPALTIKVTGDFCDVFVGIPQGDVLANERLSRGDLITFDEPRLSAVVSNGAAAEVTVNGELQPAGKPGERQAFTVDKKEAESAQG